MSNPSTPFLWKGDARRAGGWPKAKESEANLRRCAPPPSRGRREKRDGRGLVEGEKERSQPPALRATSFQRKEGEVVKNLSPTFQKREKRDE